MPVVQGSAIGPFCFIASASGLRPKCNGNEMGKYADDCYLIIPASNSSSIQIELANVNSWAAYLIISFLSLKRPKKSLSLKVGTQ